MDWPINVLKYFSASRWSYSMSFKNNLHIWSIWTNCKISKLKHVFGHLARMFDTIGVDEWKREKQRLEGTWRRKGRARKERVRGKSLPRGPATGRGRGRKENTEHLGGNVSCRKWQAGEKIATRKSSGGEEDPRRRKRSGEKSKEAEKKQARKRAHAKGAPRGPPLLLERVSNARVGDHYT